MKSAILLALCGCAYALKVPQLFVNDNVHRTLDLSTHVVREKRAIAVLPAEGQKPGQKADYYLSVEQLNSAPGAAAAFVEAKQKIGEETVDIAVQRVGEPESIGDRKLQYYKVQLDKATERTVVMFDITYLGALTPFPTKIAQNEKQLVLFYGNIYCPSPYATKKHRLKITLSSGSVESFSNTLEPVLKSGKTISYGPYETEVPANAYEPLSVHFENNSPFLTVESLQRELWLSHWGGNLAVEEWYALRHDGAKLNGQFSRIDYALTGHLHARTSVVKGFGIELPAHVTEPYYRDDIGNVSTSNFKVERTRTVLEMRPRFPLYGGWIYTWYHGYNVPLSDFVKYESVSGRYILQALFVKGIENAPIEKFTLKIVLPEDATDIQIHLPFEVESSMQNQTFTYLDSVGRPTLYLTKTGLVDEHSQSFQVSYKIGYWAKFRKPIVLSLGFLALYMLVVVYGRMEVGYTVASKSSKKTQ